MPSAKTVKGLSVQAPPVFGQQYPIDMMRAVFKVELGKEIPQKGFSFFTLEITKEALAPSSPFKIRGACLAFFANDLSASGLFQKQEEFGFEVEHSFPACVLIVDSNQVDQEEHKPHHRFIPGSPVLLERPLFAATQEHSHEGQHITRITQFALLRKKACQHDFGRFSVVGEQYLSGLYI